MSVNSGPTLIRGNRSLGQFFQDEIAAPLELDFYIRLPEAIPTARLATLDKGNPFKANPLPLVLAAMNPRSNIHRALVVNPGCWLPLDEERVYARNLEVPSGGGVGTARAIARVYSVFATGGRELQLRPETLQALAAPPVPPRRGFYDECLKGEVQFSLGFMKPCANWSFGHPGAFGSPRGGRLSRLRRSSNRDRIRVRHEPNGPEHGRSAGRRAEKRDS